MMTEMKLACATALALIMAAPAFAQTTSAPNTTQDPSATSADAPASTPASAPTPAQTRGNAPAGPILGDDNPNRKVFGSPENGQNRTGPLSTLGRTLADHGIRFRSLLTNEYADIDRGGASRGKGDDNVGQWYIGTDLDFDKIVGWKGASLHITGYRDYGEGASKHITGTFFKQQDIYKNEFPQWHFGLMAFEQRLFHDHLDVIVGRLGTTAYYGHLVSNCYFQNGSTCGVPTVLNSETGFGLLPSATWGGNVKYSFSSKVYAEAGAYEVNPTIADSNGFHHWSTKGATGFTVPFEIGYQDTNFRKTMFPTELKAGYYASTATRNDVFYNAKGQSAGLTGTALRTATSLRQGVYLMGDRTIWRPDMNKLRSLTAFAGIAKPLERDEVIDREIYGGLILRQPFESRERDTVAFGVSWLHVSPGEIAFLHDTRVHLKGPSVDENPNEVNFELNYGVGIGRAIRVTPNVQYTVNPEASNIPKINFVPKNLLTFGVKLTIDLVSLIGFPAQEVGGE